MLSASIPAFSSIISAIQDLARTQSTQFESLKESIARVKKDLKRQKKRISKSPMIAQNAELEEKLTKAQAENLESFASLRETLSVVQHVQQDMKLNQTFLKERVDISCIKMDMVTKNTNQTGTYVLENQWSIKELQVIINCLSDKLTSWQGVMVPTRGESESIENKAKETETKETETTMMAEEAMVETDLIETFQERISYLC